MKSTLSSSLLDALHMELFEQPQKKYEFQQFISKEKNKAKSLNPSFLKRGRGD
jgi:hypothetical protein